MIAVALLKKHSFRTNGPPRLTNPITQIIYIYMYRRDKCGGRIAPQVL